MSPPPTAITRAQWLTLTAALLGWFFDGFEMGVFPIVARPALRQLLGEGHEEQVRQWLAIVTAAFLFGAAVGGVLFGWLGDRVGRVRAMAASVLTYALLTGLAGFAQTAWQLTVLRFLAALGMGGEWALGVALLVETWPARRRPLLAGLIGAVLNVGYVSVAILSLWVKPEEAWRTLLMVCATPALLTFLLRLFVPESEAWQHAATTGPRPRLTDFFAPELRSRSLIGAAAGAIALLATWGAVQLTQPWAQKMGADQNVPNAGAWVQICSAGGASAGAFLAPVVLAPFSRRWSYAGLCLVSLVAAQSLFQLHDTYSTAFLTNVTVTGFFTATFYGWLTLYLPELFPTRVRAAGQGFCYNAGRTLAATGVLVTTFGVDVRGNYPLAASAVCWVYLLGPLLMLAAPETRREELLD